MGAIADLQGIAIVTKPATATHALINPAKRPVRFLARDSAPDVAPLRPALIRSGVNGNSLKRTPVASKIAFAIAAALGIEDDSPIPSGGRSLAGIRKKFILGTARNFII